jgi:hypothetical protein
MKHRIARLFAVLILALACGVVFYAEHLRTVAASVHQSDPWLGFIQVWPQYIGMLLCALLASAVSFAIAVTTRPPRP